MVPLKHGCHVEGADLGVDVIEKNFPADVEYVEHVQIKTGDAVEVVADACEQVASIMVDCFAKRMFPLVIGGDHSLGIGSVAAASTKKNVGVVWFDAHGDINTPDTSPTLRIHGMPLAVSLGHGYEELVNVHRPGAKITNDQLVFVGSRDFDEGELAYTKSHDIPVHTYTQIKEKGLMNFLFELDEQLARFDTIHVSFDLDVINPNEFGAINIPVMDGFARHEAKLIISHLFSQHHVCSMDLVEYNPLRDRGNEVMFVRDVIDMVLECNCVYDIAAGAMS